MFRMLKAKQVADYLPLLKDPNELEARSDEENKVWIHNHFMKLFREPDEIRKEQDPYIERIKQVKKQVISTYQAKTLERPLTKEELESAIDLLKNKKSLGKDGLPAEFFKTFKDVLFQPLLDVWQEATKYNALSILLNEGIIKLIHKKEEKENINNWTPITIMLNCA